MPSCGLAVHDPGSSRDHSTLPADPQARSWQPVGITLAARPGMIAAPASTTASAARRAHTAELRPRTRVMPVVSPSGRSCQYFRRYAAGHPRMQPRAHSGTAPTGDRAAVA